MQRNHDQDPDKKTNKYTTKKIKTNQMNPT